jgi:hypothetical protein
MIEPDRAVLIGGLRDGEEFAIHDYSRPEVIRTVEPAPFRWDAEPTADPFIAVEYRLARYKGWPSRDDQGRLRYVLVNM